jgi:hypothetical protein
MKFRVRFTGREVGAIGITYEIETEVEIDIQDAVIMKLYDNYEHISGVNYERLD